MRIAWLLVLVGCGSSPMPASRTACDRADWMLMRARRHCSDIRTGFSGYWVLEIVDGPHAGKLVVADYNEAAMSYAGNWNLARAATFAPITPGNPIMENTCTVFGIAGAPRASYDGSVNTLEPNVLDAFEDEAAARAARANRC